MKRDRISNVDLVAGVLGIHRLQRPGCTCGGCPASMWTCACDVVCVDEPAARQHVAEQVVDVLGLPRKKLLESVEQVEPTVG